MENPSLENRSSEFSAKDYLDVHRSLLNEGQRFSGAVKEEAREGAELLSEYARDYAAAEYDGVKALVGILTGDTEFEDELRSPYLDSFAKKVYSLAIASERAKRKGLLDTDITELSGAEHEALFAELSQQFREVNNTLEANNPELTPQKLELNPVLYHTAEGIKKIAEEFPQFSDYEITLFITNSPISVRETLASVAENASRLIPKYRELMPENYIWQLLIRNTTDPEGVLRKYVEDVERICEAHPEYKKHFIQQIVLSNRTDPDAAVESTIQKCAELQSLFPDIPDSVIRHCARGFKNPVAAAERILTYTQEIVQKFGLAKSDAMQIAAFKSAAPIKSAEEAKVLIAELRARGYTSARDAQRAVTAPKATRERLRNHEL